ncbi:MAG TPA: DUF3108 domain-containing protein [Candidatus Binataceae bacterium]|nr:DUF3108 domain-containing protein [Candidatus Binataceae bacterium]
MSLKWAIAALSLLSFAVLPVMLEGGPIVHLADAYAAALSSAHPQPSPTPLPLPQNLKIPSYPPGPPTFHDGETLFYQGTWLGVPAASARVLVGRDRTHPGLWRGQMWITSSAIVDLIYRMRDYIREDFWRNSYQPNNIFIQQHENKRLDDWHTTFDHQDHLVTAIKRNRRGQTTERLFSGGNPLGPFSGAMMALSQPLKPGDNLTFDVFSGGNRYVFAFKVIDRERITTELGTFDTLKIEPSVLWLSQGNFRNEARDTTIWVTDDGRHLPVRIAADVFFGYIYADLVKVEDKGSETAASSRANVMRADTDGTAGAPPTRAPLFAFFHKLED